VSVWIPELRLLLAGDAAERPFPYVGDPDGLPMLRRSLRALAALAPATVIPCHGGPTNAELLARNLAYFDELERRARAALADGALPPDWREHDDLPELLGLSYEAALLAQSIAPESVPELWGYRRFHLLACRAALLDVAAHSEAQFTSPPG
jgi:glyoxylase-like metal-dependent hydrolase (beta-lactamase superfamily II)